MANVLGGGTKFHLMAYRGVKIIEGKVQLRITTQGKINKSCGGRYKGQLNARSFSEYLNENPEWLCKKCIANFNRLMAEAKGITK